MYALSQAYNAPLTEPIVAVCAFYVQTWDEYYTHVLTLGIVSGPVEGVLTLCVVFAFTGYVGGASFWHRSMLETVGIPCLEFIPDEIYNMPFTTWYMVYGGFMLFFAIGSSVLNVMRVRRERGQDPYRPLTGLIPLATTWTLVPAYLYLQPVILKNHLIPFILYAGLINAYSVGQIIVAHLVKADFPYYNVLLVPLTFGVIDSLGPHLGLWPSALGNDVYQVAFMFMSLGIAVGMYGCFAVCDRHGFTSLSGRKS
jgi:ethanolaminephosphotransferase